MEIVLIILFILLGTVLGGLQAIGNRRWDAYIRAREDYDEDVDGKMTKKEKEAFEARKEAEAKLIRMPVKDILKERPGRFAACLFLGAAGSTALFLFYGVNAATWTLLAFFTVMILIAMIDLDTMEIPFSLNLVILGLGLLSLLTFQWTEPFSEITIVNRIVGMLVIAGPMLILDLIIPGAFGGGDIKMMFAAGFLLGWKIIVCGFFFGAVIGGVVGVTVMICRKKGRKEHIPFGPSLCAGMAIAVFAGTQMIDWYIEILKRAMGKG
ncbi:MAG: prepilin peptidase [Eubacterium sp.]|nr:prepilin peptidase [Eubacterium sp.]MBR6172660.1 prepilin peptidase [Eubacterium sp.]